MVEPKLFVVVQEPKAKWRSGMVVVFAVVSAKSKQEAVREFFKLDDTAKSDGYFCKPYALPFVVGEIYRA